MAAHNIFGKQGEEIAAAYLLAHHYTIRDRNWRHRRRELDIIAETADEIIIVEVKSRKDCAYARPEEAVDNRKIRHIVGATSAYLLKYKIDKPVRFDIICIVGSIENPTIEHIKEAFHPPIW
ncbi:MAG: YraN family protein [Bacteroidaceae bacterium]|nr:YraN family protein [Bacteroidaceae bacterium]